jgi:hypothetical protein
MRLRYKVLFAAGAAIGVLAAAGAPAGAQGVGGFGASPAHPDPADPATRAYFKPVIAPGGSLTDQVVVTSTSSKPIRLIVSAVDGRTGQTSGAVYANRQDLVTRAGAWVTPAVSSLTLAAHSQQVVDFTVRVPAAAVPGDHLAGLAFENADPTTSGGKFGVTEVVRTVVGVEITVPGPAASHVRLSGLSLAALPGLRYATLTIHIGDDGRKLVKPVLTVSLTGPSGYHRTLHRALDTILPGDTIAYPFVWPDNLAAGDYVAKVTAANGSEREVETATLHLGAALKGTTKPGGVLVTTTTAALGSIPLLAIAVGLLAMTLFAGFRLGSRRQPRLAR